MENVTPRTRRKAGLLSGAKAYFSGGGKDRDGSSAHRRSSLSGVDGLRTPQDFLSKTHSESALQSPVTPRTREKRRNKLTLLAGLTSSRDVADTPVTPSRAKQKIRRASLRDSSVHSVTSQGESSRMGRSLEEAIYSGTPSRSEKKKLSRRGSLERAERASSAHSLDDQKGSKERELARGKKKSRHQSEGGLVKDKSKRTPRTPKRASTGGNSLADVLGKSPLPLNDSPMDGSRRKNRTTVDVEGKIRRRRNDSGEDSDGEGDKSRQSSSSKRSKSSKSSKKSVSKKAREKAEARKKLLSPRGRSSRDVDTSSHSRKGSEHRHSKSPRGRTEDESGSRRGGRRVDMVDKIGDPGLDLKSQLSEKSFRTSDTDKGVDFEDLPDYASEEPADKDQEIARLKKKIVELNEESLKAQFQAQSETAKLRKELREEKLELQRSQTERRELRAELRDRNAIIDESDRKIQALEKAVESQLDKVDDLEDELRRTNEELFDMEEKLTDMEQVLADSSAVENKGLGKENDMGENRLKRMERRLEDREREIAQREKRLREERDSLYKEGELQRNTAKLEQDNRMLLKALNREKAEAAERLKEKEDEIDQLQKQLKTARMRSYSQLNPGNIDASVTKLISEKVALQQQLDQEIEENMKRLQEKQDQIVSLRKEVQRLKDTEGSSNIGGSSMHSGGLVGELEAAKAETNAMQSKYEAAQRRNQLLEDDIDHWKSVNCRLEDEVVELKSQIATWRAKYEDAAEEPEHSGNGNNSDHLPFNIQRDTSLAQLATHRRGEDDDAKTVNSERTGSIASLWNKLTSPSARKPVVNNMDQVREVLARSTFH